MRSRPHRAASAFFWDLMSRLRILCILGNWHVELPGTEVCWGASTLTEALAGFNRRLAEWMYEQS